MLRIKISHLPPVAKILLSVAGIKSSSMNNVLSPRQVCSSGKRQGEVLRLCGGFYLPTKGVRYDGHTRKGGDARILARLALQVMDLDP